MKTEKSRKGDDICVITHGNFYEVTRAQIRNESLKIIQQLIVGIARCLISLHEKGIVHGDVSTRNIDIMWSNKDANDYSMDTESIQDSPTTNKEVYDEDFLILDVIMQNYDRSYKFED